MKTAALAQVIFTTRCSTHFSRAQIPLHQPHAAPKGVGRNHRDAEELIQSKSAALVGVAVHKREGNASRLWFAMVGGGGDEYEDEGGPSDLAWSCTDCKELSSGGMIGE